MKDEEIMSKVPESLKDYVYVVDGTVNARQKLPENLVEEFEKFKKSLEIPKCPNCGANLTLLMPDGKVFYCNTCGKYYKNENGTVGEETTNPYTNTEALY